MLVSVRVRLRCRIGCTVVQCISSKVVLLMGDHIGLWYAWP